MNADLFATARRAVPCLLLASLLAVNLTSASHAAKIHKWVDDNGKTHFGDRPPADGTPSQKVRIRDIPESDLRVPSNQERRARQDYLLRSFDEERTKKKQAAARDKEQKKQLTKTCQRANDDLQALRRSNYLYESDASGKRVIHSNETREEVIRALEKDISEHCR